MANFIDVNPHVFGHNPAGEAGLQERFLDGGQIAHLIWLHDQNDNPDLQRNLIERLKREIAERGLAVPRAGGLLVNQAYALHGALFPDMAIADDIGNGRTPLFRRVFRRLKQMRLQIANQLHKLFERN